MGCRAGEVLLNGLPPIPPPEALALRTDRIDLLPINRQHAESLFPVLSDPELYAFTGGSPPTDVESLSRRYETWESRTSPDGSELWFNWALRLRTEGRLIGYVQAGVSIDNADMAWVVGSRWQHQGYATEGAKAVLEWLLQFGVRKIRASINPGHTASIRVAERLGLQLTPEFSGTERIWRRMRVDEPIEVVDYDPVWAGWYATDAEELNRVFGVRLREVQHFGSTSVPVMAAKPIIDILVAPASWPLTEMDRQTFESLGYEYLGEAGVPGREYFRRRSAHDTNLAVVEWRGTLWHDNLLVRDYLRAHADAAGEYARLKGEAWRSGARTLLAYSERKAHHVAALVEAAKAWLHG